MTSMVGVCQTMLKIAIEEDKHFRIFKKIMPNPDALYPKGHTIVNDKRLLPAVNECIKLNGEIIIYAKEMLNILSGNGRGKNNLILLIRLINSNVTKIVKIFEQFAGREYLDYSPKHFLCNKLTLPSSYRLGHERNNVNNCLVEMMSMVGANFR